MLKNNLLPIVTALLFAACSNSLSAQTAVAPPQVTTTTATTSKPWPDPKRFDKTIAEFEKADGLTSPPKGAILAYGSSSMRGWHKTIQQDLAPLTIIPRGFGGSTMNDAVHFMDRVVIPYKPRAVLLYEGDNDVASGKETGEIVAKYEEFVKRMATALPETRIYILSTKPSESRWKHWPATQELNKRLKELCSTAPRLTFIDVATPLLDAQGQVKKELFLNDKLHMKPEGYAVWTSVVRPVLMEREAKFEKASASAATTTASLDQVSSTQPLHP